MPLPVSNAGAEVWLDMKGYSGVFFLVGLVNAGGTGPEVLKIVADANADGSGGNVEIATSTSSAVTHEGGYMIVECTAEQIAQEGADNNKALRYVSIDLEMHHSGDEAAVFAVRYGPRFAHGTLSAGSPANASIS